MQTWAGMEWLGIKWKEPVGNAESQQERTFLTVANEAHNLTGKTGKVAGNQDRIVLARTNYTCIAEPTVSRKEDCLRNSRMDAPT